MKQHHMAVLGLCLGSGLFFGPAVVLADTPEQILERYAEQARMEDPSFEGFSVERGHVLYFQKRAIPEVGEINCASCHLADPRQTIIAHSSKVLCRQCHVMNNEEHPHPKSAKKREILPLAPSANPQRITSYALVEEYLKPNCKMVYGRVCTAKEKGDVLSWIISIK